MVIQIPPKIITVSMCDCRTILKYSSKSDRNLLSNGLISDWAVSMHMVIQIATQIQSLVPFTTPDPSRKFHCNPLIFASKRYRKHDILCIIISAKKIMFSVAFVLSVFLSVCLQNDKKLSKDCNKNFIDVCEVVKETSD